MTTFELVDLPPIETIAFELVDLPADKRGRRPSAEKPSVVADGHKWCSKCKRVLPVGDFNKHRGKRDGLQSYCRECHRRAAAKWDGENRDYKAEYRAGNAEKIAAYKAAYYQANKDRIIEHMVAYRKANPHLRTARLYRKRGGASEHVITLRDLDRLRYVRQNNQCALCDETLSDEPHATHLDHKIPVARGGSHSIGNVQWLCSTCNNAKGNLLPMEYRMKQRKSKEANDATE